MLIQNFGLLYVPISSKHVIKKSLNLQFFFISGLNLTLLNLEVCYRVPSKLFISKIVYKSKIKVVKSNQKFNYYFHIIPIIWVLDISVTIMYYQIELMSLHKLSHLNLTLSIGRLLVCKQNASSTWKLYLKPPLLVLNCNRTLPSVNYKIKATP